MIHNDFIGSANEVLQSIEVESWAPIAPAFYEVMEMLTTPITTQSARVVISNCVQVMIVFYYGIMEGVITGEQDFDGLQS